MGRAVNPYLGGCGLAERLPFSAAGDLAQDGYSDDGKLVFEFCLDFSLVVYVWTVSGEDVNKSWDRRWTNGSHFEVVD